MNLKDFVWRSMVKVINDHVKSSDELEKLKLSPMIFF